MKKIVLTFGLISGAILGGLTAIMIPYCMNGHGTLDNAEVLGYTIMVLCFVLVFVGIRSYRENHSGGAISFGKAFQVGILITLVASAVYVVSWEIVYFNFVPDFGEKYAAHSIEKSRAQGASPEALEKMKKDMDRFQRLYKNPFFNSGMTFMEVFPVGLLVTLVSAAVLRKRPPADGRRVATASA